MKTNYIFLVLAVIACSCIDTPKDMEARKAAQISAVETLADYDVPVQEGMTTVVKIGADTLAVTRESTRISVPRYALASGVLEVSYTTEDIYENFASFRYWQYISFEDTRKGDYDYNDLVIHCRVRTDKVYKDQKVQFKHIVSVQPVALGSSGNLKLGILYKVDLNAETLAETILTENVRRDLFFGNPIFPINTDASKEIKKVTNKMTPLFEVYNMSPEFKVVWFIEAAAGRLYAATTNFGANATYDMISPDGLPYGISLTKKWDYPIEKSHIRNAYSGFDEWIRTGNEETLLNKPNKSFVFPAIMNGSGNEDLWDWDKNS